MRTKKTTAKSGRPKVGLPHQDGVYPLCLGTSPAAEAGKQRFLGWGRCTEGFSRPSQSDIRRIEGLSGEEPQLGEGVSTREAQRRA